MMAQEAQGNEDTAAELRFRCKRKPCELMTTSDLRERKNGPAAYRGGWHNANVMISLRNSCQGRLITESNVFWYTSYFPIIYLKYATPMQDFSISFHFIGFESYKLLREV